MLFSPKLTPFDVMLNDLQDAVEDITIPEAAVSASVSMESAPTPDEMAAYNETAGTLDHMISKAISDNPEAFDSLGVSMEELEDPNSAARNLAIAGCTMSASQTGGLPAVSRTIQVSNHEVIQGSWNPSEVSMEEVSMESFDERDIAKLKSYTIQANLFAGFGTKFSRAIAPMYATSPDEIGIKIIVDMMYIQEDKKHDITGKLNNWNRKSLAQCMINGDYLEPSSTDIIPVFRKTGNVTDDTTAAFVSDADYNVQKRKMGSITIDTLPLKAGLKADLKGLATHDALVKEGLMDWSDTIEPDLTLREIFLHFPNGGDARIGFDVSAEVTAGYRATQQTDSTGLYLNFGSETILITPASLDVKAGPLPAPLDVIKTGNGGTGYTVHLAATVQGTMDVQNGNGSVNMNESHVVDIVDANGQSVDMTAGEGKAIVDGIAGAIMEGYTLDGRFSNLNLRHKIPHITTRAYSVNYVVGISSPIAMYRPPSQIDAFKDTSMDLKALLTTLTVRADNKTVEILRSTAVKLKAYKDAKFSDNSSQPELFGVGSLLATATYSPGTIDVAAIVNSVRSQDKMADVISVISDRINLEAINTWTKSGMLAAVASLPPGYNKKPVFVVATDPKLADLIDMSKFKNDNFTYEVVSSPNKDMTGMIMGIFRFNQPGSPHPLSFAFSSSAPSIVFNNNISKDGATVKMLATFPRYEVFLSCSVLVALSVSNVDEAFKTKITLPNT